MEKDRIMDILEDPMAFSNTERQEAAKGAIAILDGIAQKEESDQAYYHFVMYGNEGLEGYLAVQNEKDISDSTLKSMELRARINSHRNISGYAFKASMKVDPDMITKDLLAKAVKIF